MAHKYNAKKTGVDGITFDSKKEAERYKVLKGLQEDGHIGLLELQPRFELQPSFKYQGKTERKIEYVADFKYVDFVRGCVVVEDVKGVRTDVYKLKRKLFLCKYGDGITFEEV